MLVVVLTIVQMQFLALLPSVITAKIIDRAIPSRNFPELISDVAIICFAALLSAGLGTLQFYCKTYVGEAIMRDVRTLVVSRVHCLPLSFFVTNRSGEIMNRVSGDADAIERIVTDTLANVTTQVLTIVSALALMFAWNWRLALIALCVVPIMVVPMAPVGKNMYKRQKELRAQRDRLESLMQQTLSVSAIALIKSFCREPYERRRFLILATRLMKAELKFAVSGQTFVAVISAMVAIGPAALWLSGGWLSIQKEVTVGTLVAFVGLVLTRMYTPAANLLNIRLQIVSGRAIFERIFQYLDLPSEPEGEVAGLDFASSEIVSFKNVTFAYPSGQTVLQSVSFQIKQGEVVALVGPSGCGKTTIANLIMRYYAPTNGAILVGGTDISCATKAALRSSVGIVAQETYLFHDTIAENLRYAKRNATDWELELAARKANIHDFIMNLPEKYETVVGDRGQRLSGGQRQRLAIARILLKEPSLLIFDEATNALDSPNEVEIQSAVANAMKGRTCLIITHRLSAIASADRILFIEDGAVVESGTHAELLLRRGRYWDHCEAAS